MQDPSNRVFGSMSVARNNQEIFEENTGNTKNTENTQNAMRLSVLSESLLIS
jgi:hypothetical protein